MGYEVLARKWRPQQFEDVVGQEHVTRTLGNAIENERIAHAYLFVGPRGIGKTSVARIFAKALNCEKGLTPQPCNECDCCREIAGGSSLDVLEIDGASNNGVEQVRDLRDTVKYAPVRGRFKIYIIDEVHMLSTAAFNALLKTLEEPPPYVKFIFATTEPEKILPTIISRCQRFNLRRIPVNLIVERLRLIADDEEVKVDDDALLAIARGSEGGLRDAESALDQLISFCGKSIQEQDVLSVFGLVSREAMERLAGEILSGDVKSLIEDIHALDAEGKDLQRLLSELLGYFRNLVVAKHVNDVAEALDLTDVQVAALQKQAAGADTDRLLRVAEILTETDNRMKFALSRRTLLEMALVRSARAAKVVSLDEVLKRLVELKSSGGGEPPPRGEPVGRGAEPREPLPPKASQGTMSKPPDPDVVSEPEPEGDDAASPSQERELAIVSERWREIVERVGKITILARSALAGARPVRVTGNRVVVRFEPEFENERKAAEEGRSRRALEHVLGEVLRKTIQVGFEVGSLPAETSPVLTSSVDSIDTSDGVDEGDDDATLNEAIPSELPPMQSDGRVRTKQEWYRDPAVQKTVEMFDGAIVDIRQ